MRTSSLRGARITISGAMMPAYGISEIAMRWRNIDAMKAKGGVGLRRGFSWKATALSVRRADSLPAAPKRRRSNSQTANNSRAAEAADPNGPVALSSANRVTAPGEAYELSLFQAALAAYQGFNAPTG